MPDDQGRLTSQEILDAKLPWLGRGRQEALQGLQARTILAWGAGYFTQRGLAKAVEAATVAADQDRTSWVAGAVSISQEIHGGAPAQCNYSSQPTD